MDDRKRMKGINKNRKLVEKLVNGVGEKGNDKIKEKKERRQLLLILGADVDASDASGNRFPVFHLCH